MYSSPPVHGALLVHQILSHPELKAQWFGEVKEMADRILSMRAMLRSHLEELGSPLPWNHITDQVLLPRPRGYRRRIEPRAHFPLLLPYCALTAPLRSALAIQIGMFAYSGLSPEQARLASRNHTLPALPFFTSLRARRCPVHPAVWVP
jgi:aspartate/tyrosine/aromatic aminotransferase